MLRECRHGWWRTPWMVVLSPGGRCGAAAGSGNSQLWILSWEMLSQICDGWIMFSCVCMVPVKPVRGLQCGEGSAFVLLLSTGNISLFWSNYVWCGARWAFLISQLSVRGSGQYNTQLSVREGAYSCKGTNPALKPLLSPRVWAELIRTCFC